MAMAAASSSSCCLKVTHSSPVSTEGKFHCVRSRQALVCFRSAPISVPSSSGYLAFALNSKAVGPWRPMNGLAGFGARKRGISVHAAVSQTAETPKVQTQEWTWNFESNPIKIHVVEYVQSGTNPQQTLLLIPTISDVSTTEEWHAVAEGLITKSKDISYRIVCVDWPGLGLSDRPGLDYTADIFERFLVDFISAPNGPIGTSAGGPPIIIGGGHAATIAARALSKGLLNARALAAVAPTWAGPLPIVFGREPKMEGRYDLLRKTLRSAGVGWAMYKYLVSSPKNIRLQYLTHVYADADNVTDSVVENRTALTLREGARFAPTAFLTGLLDPARSREEFLELFANLDGKVPTLVISSSKSPKRSKAEMQALNGAKGVTKFSQVPGALLPQEEYPDIVCDELLTFLQSIN